MKKILLNKPYWLLSALLWGLSYPSYDTIPTGVLAWFAFVPFLWSIREQLSFKEYFLKASLMIIVMLFIDVWWVGIYGFEALLVCVFSQFPFLLLPLLTFYFLQKRYGFQKALWFLPFIWTLSDWFAHITPHGLQVYLLAYTQANNIWLIQFADTFGMWGITFWVMLMNILIVKMIDLKSIKSLILPISCLVLPLLYSVYCMVLSPKSAIGTNTRTAKISLIQTNLDSYSNDSLSVQKTFDEIVSLTDSAVRTAHPDLIVLPEAVIPLPLFQDKNLLNFTKKAITSWQTSVALGFVEYPDSTQKHIFRNNALVFTPQLATYWDSLKIKPQDVKIYQKQYGLPFVELMPYFEDKPTLRGSAMQRGNEPYLFSFLDKNEIKTEIALTICWEQMYPEKVASLVNEGAEMIALMNNDAWFGTSPGAKQLLSFTRMRAIENRRSIARCSNGGISCFIDPVGRISGKLPWFKSAIGTQEVLTVSKKSFYTKHPYFFVKTIGVILLIMVLYGEFLRKKSRL